jgi:recombination protein RecA
MASSPAVAASHSSFPDFSPRNAKQAVLEHLAETPRLARVTAASHLEIRPAPETVSFGIAALDALTGGLPRGSLTEISGPDSSGRTSVLLAALAAATQRGEICALIDATDSFHPHSAVAAGVDLTRLLWVRCNATTPIAPSKSSQPESQSKSASRANTAASSRPRRNSSTHSSSNSARTREPRPARQLRESRDGYVSVQTHLATDAQGVRNFFQPSSGPRTRSAHAANAAPEQPDLFSQETARAEWKRRKMEDPVEQALRATDLILQSGGFGMVAIDLAGVPVKTARRVPLTTWFRFRRVIENTPTILLLIDEQPCAQTCTSLGLKMAGQEPSSVVGRRSSAQKPSAFRNPLKSLQRRLKLAPHISAGSEHAIIQESPSGDGTHFISHSNLFEGMHIHAELLRTHDRKPAQSVTHFPSKAAWTG